MSHQPHQLTQKEMQDRFLQHLWMMVREWGRDSIDEPVERCLEGLAFSFLVVLDGMAMDLPAFILLPSPHPDDEDFAQEEGTDWWPDADEGISLHGNEMLHDRWHSFGVEHGFVVKK